MHLRNMEWQLLKAQLYSYRAEHDAEFKKLRYVRAAARTDVTRKCKLQTYCNRLTDIVIDLFNLLKRWCCVIA